MAADFKVVIIGSGPAGLSAAVHAAKGGVSHVLLERTDHINNTIFRYQKRKHVMATPEVLPLRSDLEFEEESREELIDSWTGGSTAAGINIRFNTEVSAIKGEKGNFQVQLVGGGVISAEYVVLAIGVQGNFNRLRVPGADLPFVQYQLDDPDEYREEKIAVIGVGDAGIENALALATNNEVYVLNQKDDFPRAKAGNRALIMAAVAKNPDEAGSINHVVNVETQEIVAGPPGQPGELVLHRADGATVRVACNRVIARIGAQPPRRFLEDCGIVFTSADRNAIPEVSETYESGVKGLYIIGALAGYPLIKHCLNQGYEVIEYILGNELPPADEPLIQAKLTPEKIRVLDPSKDAMTGAELIGYIRARAPMFSGLKPIQIREFLIHAELHRLQPGDVVFRRGESTNSLYTILDGQVGIQIDPTNPAEMVHLGPGQFFGEMGLISGRKRTATVVAAQPSLLLEVDRNTMIRLERSEASIKQAIDSAAVIRQIKTFLAPQVEDSLLAEVVATSKIVEFKPDQKLIEEDAEDDAVYLIRKGSVTVSMRVGGKDVVLAYVPAGNYVGEMAMITRRRRAATVTAASVTEAIRIDSSAFRKLLDRDPDLRRRVEDKLEQRLAERNQMQQNAETGDLIKFLVREGLGEATNVLLIDESLCVRCDNCEKACAETHHGVSRLNREAGPTFAMVHVPTSCRHCEDPHCMTDCPPDAIHRAPNGEVFINDQCIGCENCKNNCPYGVIQMAAVPEEKPGLLSWLLFGWGAGPGEDKSPEGMAKRTGGKHAVKCDMCKDLAGPACVRACPTGAAIRVDPAGFIDVMRQAQA
ncbi:MAG TPA: cyclic nucleotide-binding domain-containing protein [Stellaceae bacterium]|nr:cyclic nucleotide-binding domain-containing protein [Stellaceae bacterium]